MANNNPNAFDFSTFGFFTDYPPVVDVESGVEFAHDQTGTLEVETVCVVLPISVKVNPIKYKFKVKVVT